jgi:hypothetical protein
MTLQSRSERQCVANSPRAISINQPMLCWEGTLRASPERASPTLRNPNG